MGDGPVTYAIPEPQPDSDKPPKPGTSAVQLALTLFGIILALTVAVLALLHSSSADSTVALQATRIQNLESANTRMAGQLAALSNRQTQMSAQVSAADPANDSTLITCADLRHMHLTATTGGSIEAGGVIGLGENPVPLPGHCH